MTPKRLASSAVSRDGVNYVRTTLEHANCIFREIHQENDYGNDAFLELVDGEEVTGEHLVAQIKAGKSYCDTSRCWIPATQKQLAYWRRHRLPVVGFVFDPAEGCAYWVNISRRLRGRTRNTPPGRIVFLKSDLSRFDDAGLREVFLPAFLGKAIRLGREQSARLATSDLFDEHSVGLMSLFYGYWNDLSTWDTLEHLLLSRRPEETTSSLPYFLAHAPGHGDIIWPGQPYLDEGIRAAVMRRMFAYRTEHVRALLARVDENGFGRGTIGQSVHAIVAQAVAEPGKKLRDIVRRVDEDVEVRRNALYLLCLVEQEGAASFLTEIDQSADFISGWAGELLSYLRQEGFFYP